MSTKNVTGRIAFLVGLSGFLAWQNALTNYLFTPSAGHIVSPLFASFLSGSLLLVYCYVSYKHDSTLLTPGRLSAWFITCAIAGSVAACLVALRVLPPWSLYVAGLITGFSCASCAYLWATIAMSISAAKLLPNLAGALVISSAAEIAFMNGGDFGSAIAAPVFGAVSLAGFLLISHRSIAPTEDVLVRPKNVNAYLRIAIAVTLLAAALGVTAGTTAAAATESGMGTINRNVSLVALVAGLTALAAFVISQGRTSFINTLRVFLPALVLVMLMNIIASSYIDMWLAITLFSWRLISVLAFGLIVEFSRSGVASLVLAFPAGWSVLYGGYALGILIGQAFCTNDSSDAHGVQVAIVMVVMATVIAAMLLFDSDVSRLFSSKKNLAKAAPNEIDNETARALSAPEAVIEATEENEPAGKRPVQKERPLTEVLAAIAKRYKLTEREVEVAGLLVHGHTRAAIAKKLFVSENTVRAHVKNIYAKLGVHSKQQLIDFVECRMHD